MATTSDIKNGLCLNLNGKLVTIVEFQHVKPGKGPAFVRTKYKEIESGKVVEHTFSAGHKIDVVRIETRQYQYLYEEGELLGRLRKTLKSKSLNSIGLRDRVSRYDWSHCIHQYDEQFYSIFKNKQNSST